MNGDQNKIPCPVRGCVRFENWPSAAAGKPQVLKNVTLRIPAERHIGVVGQAAAGRLLMKLLPRLYSETGRILFDGYDIDKVELYSRVVKLASFPGPPAVRGSVSDNIALTNPDASSDSIVEAAKLACAHTVWASGRLQQ